MERHPGFDGSVDGRPDERARRHVPGRSARGQAAQEVLVAPERVLPAIKDPRILGVVSSSTSKSIKIYNDQESHDKWLFFFGQDPKKPPRIVYYGEKH